jgi:hypothetical protein
MYGAGGGAFSAVIFFRLLRHTEYNAAWGSKHSCRGSKKTREAIFSLRCPFVTS